MYSESIRHPRESAVSSVFSTSKQKAYVGEEDAVSTRKVGLSLTDMAVL